MSIAHLPWRALSSPRWWKVLLWCAPALVFGDVVRLLVLPSPYQQGFTDAFEAVIVLFGALTFGYAAARSSKLTRALLGMTAAYFALNAIADIHDLLVDVHVSSTALLLPLEFLGWCLYPTLAAMIFFPTLEEGRLKWKWLPVIDFAQVGIAVALMYFRFIYLHHVSTGEDWTHFGTVELVRNILICSGLLIRGFLEPSARARTIYRAVGGAFASITFLKWLFPVYEAFVPAIGRPAILLGLGIFAACWKASSDDEVVTVSAPPSLRLGLSAMATATLAIVLMLADGDPEQYRWVTRGVIAVSVALFILRHFVADHKRHVTEEDLRKSEADLSLAQMVGHIGSWRFDIRHNTVALSHETCRIIGIPPGSSISLEEATASIHQDDRERLQNAWHRALKTGSFESEFRYLIQGDIRWVHALAHPEFDSQGLALAAIGTVQDITERKRSQSRLQEFERVVEGVEDMIMVIDRNYRYIIANSAFLRFRGMKSEEVIGHRIDEVIDPSVFRTTVKAKMDECFHGRIVRYELQYKFPVLGERCLFVSYFPIAGPTGIERLVCVLRDVTEKKRAAAALRESEDRYRDLVEHSEDLICTHDLSGNLLSVNPAPARILGYETSELLKIPMRELVAPEFREQFDGYLSRIEANGTDRGLLCVLSKTGDRRIWKYTNTLRTEGVPRPIVRGMAHDITECMRAESNLRRSEQQYRMLFEKNIAGAVISTLDGRVLDCNDAGARILGYGSAEELRGRPSHEFYFDPRVRSDLMEELRRTGAVQGREMQIRRKDGSGIWILYTCVLRAGEDGGSIIQATIIDISKGKEAEAALRKSEEHFRLLFEQASDGIFLADSSGRYVDVNTAGAAMLGYSRDELLQLSIANVIAEEEIPRIAPEVARFATGAVARSEWKFRRKDGTLFPGEVCGRQLPDGRLQGIVRDITERKCAEDAVRKNEERFRVALKDSPITVFNQDGELRYTWIYNPRLYWQTEILGKTDKDILGVKTAERLSEMKQRVLTTGIAVREEVSISHDGTTYALDMTLEPVFNDAREVIGITGAAMDIAQLRQLADSLQHDKDQLAREKSYLEKEIETELGFEQIVGQSPALREVLKNARVVAPTDSTVLVLGETGTGKELVARSLHALSLRSGRNFIKLNCAAVPSGLLESELFGHEKGAFTGAVNQKVGRIELADKGTLFLDEIGELPLELQPKLLRVLQDREFERLGGVRTLHVDVRIIAATNKDLWQEIADRTFREDLFYRLNVFPIHLPPLRERRSDIPVLIQHFVNKYAMRMRKRIDIIPEKTMHVLCNWNWPGNVRELENVIERMVILTKSNELAPAPAEFEIPQAVEGDNLKDMERDHILRILSETHGLLSGPDGAASRLGMKRTTLQSKMKRLGIGAHDYRNGNAQQ